MKRHIVTIAALLCAYILGDVSSARSAEYLDVQPYAFARTPNGTVYKTVHQGCELFLYEGSDGHTGDLIKENAHPVAIATGRGCR